MDIVSKRTQREFQESYVTYAVLREIEADFEDAGVRPGKVPAKQVLSGQRRSLVAEYYAAVDWTSPSQVRRVLDAYECHLLRLQDRGADKEKERLIAYLKRDGLPYADGRVEFEVHETQLDALVDKGLGLDVSQLRLNIGRIRNAVDDDPDLVIGSAKELIEATCKAILVDRGIEPPANADIPSLVHCVAKELDLVAADVADSKKGAKSIKKVLGSLSNITQGMAELRNLYGSGHGKAPGRGGLGPRHAKLASGAAATLALFLMETAVDRRDT